MSICSKIKDCLLKSPTEQINKENDTYKLLYEPLFTFIILFVFSFTNTTLSGFIIVIGVCYLFIY